MAELEDLGVALARTVSALEQVRVDALEPEDRQRLNELRELVAGETVLEREHRRGLPGYLNEKPADPGHASGCRR